MRTVAHLALIDVETPDTIEGASLQSCRSPLTHTNRHEWGGTDLQNSANALFLIEHKVVRHNSSDFDWLTIFHRWLESRFVSGLL